MAVHVVFMAPSPKFMMGVEKITKTYSEVCLSSILALQFF